MGTEPVGNVQPLRDRAEWLFWSAAVILLLVCFNRRLLAYNYRTARAYPLRRRSAFYWAWRCAGHRMKIDGFLRERFTLEMELRHGMDDGEENTLVTA